MAEALSQTFTVADSGDKAKAVAAGIGSAMTSMAGSAQTAMISESITSFNDVADGGQCGLAAMTAFGEGGQGGVGAGAGGGDEGGGPASICSAMTSMAGSAQAAMINESIMSFNDLAGGGQCRLAAMTAFGEGG